MKRDGLTALVLFLLLTVVLTLPAPLKMNQVLLGSSSDVYINPWADWWTAKALEEGLGLYHTDYIFYPTGTSLAFHSFSHANTAITLLLRPLLGHLAAYNLVILMAYPLSGLSMYLLVRYLTGSRWAAILSGLVFAFNPYHISESDHPVLVTTQWIPLFVLSLMRMVRESGTSRVKQMVLAVLWFTLTALSSWHLMMMLAGWAVTYVLYALIFERVDLAPGTVRYLALLGLLVVLVVGPFLWPIARELLATDGSYMSVDVGEGIGSDLVSFIVPSGRHPIFAPLVADVSEQLDHIGDRSAYLGLVPFGLAAVSLLTARSRSRFWLASGLLFALISLGSRVTFRGEPLHDFDLPWATPIINVVRHPFRIKMLVFFSLSVLVGFGGQWLIGRALARSRRVASLLTCILSGVLLFEYLVCPFPVTQPELSPFLDQLAEEPGEFAVADLPMGRWWAKRYLFYQIFHGRKIVDGVVSRTPDDVYAFVDGEALLGPLRSGAGPPSPAELEAQLLDLSSHGIRYVVVHKDLIRLRQTARWQNWLASFPAPFYEDDLLLVYRTTPAPNYELGIDVGLIDVDLSQETMQVGAVLELGAIWGIMSHPQNAAQMAIALIDSDGELQQTQFFDLLSDWPVNSILHESYSLHVESRLERGQYTVVMALVREEDVFPAGEEVEVGVLILEPD